MDSKKKTKLVPPPLSTQEVNIKIGEMIARHVSQLSEHLTSVQVVGTKLEANGLSTLFSFGSGDLYARSHATEIWSERAHMALVQNNDGE